MVVCCRTSGLQQSGRVLSVQVCYCAHLYEAHMIVLLCGITVHIYRRNFDVMLLCINVDIHKKIRRMLSFDLFTVDIHKRLVKCCHFVVLLLIST